MGKRVSCASLGLGVCALALCFVPGPAGAAGTGRSAAPLRRVRPPVQPASPATAISAATLAKVGALRAVPLADPSANGYRWSYPAMAVDWANGLAVVSLLETSRTTGQTTRQLRAVSLQTGSILWTDKEPAPAGTSYGFVSPSIENGRVWVAGKDASWFVKTCSLKTGAWGGWIRPLPGADPVSVLAGGGYGYAVAAGTLYRYDANGGQLGTAAVGTPAGPLSWFGGPLVSAGGRVQWFEPTGQLDLSEPAGTTNQSAPLCYVGTLYTAAKEGIYSAAMCQSAETQWHVTTTLPVASGLTASPEYNSTPATGTLYALCGAPASTLSAFRVKDGAPVWSTPLPKAPRVVARPVLVNDLLLVMGEGVYVFSAATGQLLATVAPSTDRSQVVGLEVSPDKTRACALLSNGTLLLLGLAP
jgi:outer membrane protein assembly factor BamB